MNIFRRRIYLDYAALTPIDGRVLRVMNAYSSSVYANASSLYREGVAAKKALDEGRKKVADFVHARPEEIFFTSGGTEANALAFEGAGRAAHRNGIAKPHLIISNIEHSSIMETADMLEKHGVEVTRLAVDSSGLISLDELKKAIKPNTFMVSIMTVNNETGAIQPIREIAKAIRNARKTLHPPPSTLYPLFHTDAAQGMYQDLNVEKLGVDLLTLDGSKVYGPRGIGCLYVKKGTPIEPIIYGGGQEKGLRSGTENVPAIMGFAEALEIVGKEEGRRKKENERVQGLKDYFIAGLKKIRPDIVVNGTGAPHILNVSIPGIDSELFVLRLDAKGIACSTKSSCLRDEDESYVLKAIGADSKTSVRFSFGRMTRGGDLKRALKVIEAIQSK